MLSLTIVAYLLFQGVEMIYDQKTHDVNSYVVREFTTNLHDEIEDGFNFQQFDDSFNMMFGFNNLPDGIDPLDNEYF